MTLDEIVDAVTDEIRAKNPKSSDQLDDMIKEELDKYPEVDDLPTFYRVQLQIETNFNL